jgi:hypothetical protein
MGSPSGPSQQSSSTRGAVHRQDRPRIEVRIDYGLLRIDRPLFQDRPRIDRLVFRIDPLVFRIDHLVFRIDHLVFRIDHLVFRIDLG